MSLSDIAAECGTIEEQQEETPSDRVHSEDVDLDNQNGEYETESGW